MTAIRSRVAGGGCNVYTFVCMLWGMTYTAQTKSEVLDGIAAGTIPATVASFSDLDRYVDANLLGHPGEADPGLYAAHHDADDNPSPWWDRMLDDLDAAHREVDAWLKAGGHRA